MTLSLTNAILVKSSFIKFSINDGQTRWRAWRNKDGDWRFWAFWGEFGSEELSEFHPAHKTLREMFERAGWAESIKESSQILETDVEGEGECSLSPWERCHKELKA